MVEYRDEPEEAPPVTAPRPPPSWPSAGAVEARGLQVRYRRDLPLVLKGLTFSVRPREKVGICGRTGEWGGGAGGWVWGGVKGVKGGSGG